MEPTTLRLPADLADELGEEAERYGYSSRSEYIRHVLRSRSGSDPATLGEPDRHRTDYATAEALDQLRERVAALEAQLDDHTGATESARTPADGVGESAGKNDQRDTSGERDRPARQRERPGAERRRGRSGGRRPAG